MKTVTKKMERDLQKAVKIISDVRNEILKKDEIEGLKTPMGTVLRFTLDDIIEDLKYYQQEDNYCYDCDASGYAITGLQNDDGDEVVETCYECGGDGYVDAGSK